MIDVAEDESSFRKHIEENGKNPLELLKEFDYLSDGKGVFGFCNKSIPGLTCEFDNDWSIDLEAEDVYRKKENPDYITGINFEKLGLTYTAPGNMDSYTVYPGGNVLIQNKREMINLWDLIEDPMEDLDDVFLKNSFGRLNMSLKYDSLFLYKDTNIGKRTGFYWEEFSGNEFNIYLNGLNGAGYEISHAQRKIMENQRGLLGDLPTKVKKDFSESKFAAFLEKLRT